MASTARHGQLSQVAALPQKEKHPTALLIRRVGVCLKLVTASGRSELPFQIHVGEAENDLVPRPSQAADGDKSTWYHPAWFVSGLQLLDNSWEGAGLNSILHPVRSYE